MNCPNPLLNFEFAIDPGISECDIDRLWRQTQQAQIALDRFLAGEMDELELTDYLADSEIDPDETLEIMEENAQFLGLWLP